MLYCIDNFKDLSRQRAVLRTQCYVLVFCGMLSNYPNRFLTALFAVSGRGSFRARAICRACRPDCLPGVPGAFCSAAAGRAVCRTCLIVTTAGLTVFPFFFSRLPFTGLPFSSAVVWDRLRLSVRLRSFARPLLCAFLPVSYQDAPQNAYKALCRVLWLCACIYTMTA